MSLPEFESAKAFLIERIVDEAQRAGIALSRDEVKMLGFEVGSATPKQMEAVQTFDNEYDDEQFELKIVGLIRAVYDRDVNAGRKAAWDEALDDLGDEDLYLAVMLEKAGLLKTTSSLSLPNWRLLVGLLPAGVCVALAAVVAFTPLAARWIPNDLLRLGLCALLMTAPFFVRKWTLRSSRRM